MQKLQLHMLILNNGNGAAWALFWCVFTAAAAGSCPPPILTPLTPLLPLLCACRWSLP